MQSDVGVWLLSDQRSAKIDALLCKIRPKRVQLNTVTHSPAEEFAYVISEDEMESLKKRLSETVAMISRRAAAESTDLQAGQSTASICFILGTMPVKSYSTAC